MAQRVVLHVGPHKTGSTALQMALFANAARLSRYGIHYPNTGRTGPAHQDIARACWEEASPLLPALSEEIAGHRMILISSELLSALDAVGLRRLAEALGDAEVEVVYLMRRLPHLLPSHWRELVKHGQSLDFAAYLKLAGDAAADRHLAPPLPQAQLDRFAAVFGADALRLLVYDARAVEAGAYAAGFVDDILGLGQEAERFRTGRYNLTAPDWQTELGRHFNLLAGQRLDYAAKWDLRHRLVERLDTAPPVWLDEFRTAFDSAPALALSERTPIIFAEQCLIAQRYAHAFVDPIEAYLAPTVSEVRSLPPEALTSGLRQAIAQLFEDLRASAPRPASG